MDSGSRTRQWLLRWRSNPLRRRDDVVEARIMLVMWAVITLGGTRVGTVTAHTADESLAQLRANRHTVRATLVESTMAAPPSTEGVRDDRVRARVRWTASDGSTHTGRTMVEIGRKTDSTMVVWTDDAGRLASQPPPAAKATAQAGALGASAALALGSLVYVSGRIARWRLDRRRVDTWARE
ncbi:Rv1733c family protein [Streptomyces chartreusis]|uniref:Rv1733c family protein n=1 Tax=Streptomyces chartreusis TaxID=1969 RepID=UPI0036344DED